MSRLVDFLRFDRRDARVWAGAAALLTVAFASKLSPGWMSSDDWALVTGDHDERGHRLQFLSQGRFGMALLQTALLRL
ncbi:MAG: hypothetical protein JST92_22255, partial [Deltaproteobacteria bacterium]|nr:hypothetical protein [Deltaproteobacteria bacterium]